MQIRDKAELKNKVREIVRGQPAHDLYTRLSPNPMQAEQEYGLEAMLLRQQALVSQAQRMGVFRSGTPDVESMAKELLAQNAPLTDEAQDVLRAMAALGINPKDAKPFGEKQDAAAYLEGVFGAARLEAVLCRLDPLRPQGEAVRPMEKARTYLDVTGLQRQHQPQGYADLGISQADVQVGTHYLKLAAWLFQLSLDEGAHMLMVSLSEREDFDQEAFLRHVVLPTCVKANLAMMVRLRDEDCLKNLLKIAELQRAAPSLRVVCVAESAIAGEALIQAAEYQPHLFAVLPAQQALLEKALKSLGAYFGLHSGGTRVLELLIGRWTRIRPMLALALYGRYAPMLTLDFPLDDHMIRQDVERILGGAWEAFVQIPEEKR